MQRSINQIVDELRVWAAAHVMINDMAYGDIQAIVNAADDVTYPLMAVNCVNAPVRNDAVDVQLQIIFLDRVSDFQTGQGERKQHEVESDMLQVVNDLYQTIENSDRWKNWTSLQEASPAQKFIEYTPDRVTGWMVDMTLRVWKIQGTCDLPLLDYDYDQTTSPLCAPVKIYEDGVLVETVPSGGEYSYESGGGSVYSLSLPQASYLEDVVANMIVLIQDGAGVDFPGSLVQLNIDGNTLEVRLPDYRFFVYYDGGFEITNISRLFNPEIYPEDSAGNLLPEPTFVQGGANNNEITATYADIPLTLNGAAFLSLLRSLTGQDIELVDQNDDPISPSSVVSNKITVQVGLTADFSADDTTPTVGVQVTFTDSSGDSPDHWAWDFGDGTFAQIQNPTKTYLLPGVYDVHQFAANKANDIAGFEEKENYMTVAGILDTYSDAVIGWGPVLFYRESTDDYVRIRRSSDNTTDEIGFTSGSIYDESAITTFVGANNGFVERAYNNDGSGRYFEQTTNADQPRLVNSGTIDKDNFGKPNLIFDGSNYFSGMSDFAYWPADRSKLYIAMIITPSASGSASNYMFNQWFTTGNQRSWAVVYDDTSNQLVVLYSGDGSNNQSMRFNSITAGQTIVLGVQIDTALTADNRVKGWKNTSAMTFVSRSNSVTGNIHDSTGDVAIGGAPTGTGLYGGGITCAIAIPADMVTGGERSAIEQYLYDYMIDTSI